MVAVGIEGEHFAVFSPSPSKPTEKGGEKTAHRHWSIYQNGRLTLSFPDESLPSPRSLLDLCWHRHQRKVRKFLRVFNMYLMEFARSSANIEF